MEMFNPKGQEAPSDYPLKHPVDGYGMQMLPGYGQMPELQPYRREQLVVANKRSKISERN